MPVSGNATTERAIVITDSLGNITPMTSTASENVAFKMTTDGEGDRGLYELGDDGLFHKLVHADALPASGDGWNYVHLDTLFANSTTANVDSPLSFLPEADSVYEFEAKLFLQSAATTTGVRPGIKWPTVGIAQNAAWAISPTSATAFVSRFWGTTAAANAAATAVAVANEGFYGKVEGIFATGPTVTGNFIITLASEVAASEVRFMQNSFLRYKRIR